MLSYEIGERHTVQNFYFCPTIQLVENHKKNIKSFVIQIQIFIKRFRIFQNSIYRQNFVFENSVGMAVKIEEKKKIEGRKKRKEK